MLAPVASQTRRRFKARSEMRACSLSAETGGDEEGAHLVAVGADGVRVIVNRGGACTAGDTARLPSSSASR
jgi:hypothetical protein